MLLTSSMHSDQITNGSMSGNMLPFLFAGILKKQQSAGQKTDKSDKSMILKKKGRFCLTNRRKTAIIEKLV
ncbi:MAG TPA: hypothetical protein DCG49_06730 [Ruminococcus sp.]|nr:hypothetical protein [Ruminococcus sp.]